MDFKVSFKVYVVHARLSVVFVQERCKLSVAAGGAGPAVGRLGLTGVRADPHASKLLSFTGAARDCLIHSARCVRTLYAEVAEAACMMKQAPQRTAEIRSMS